MDKIKQKLQRLTKFLEELDIEIKDFENQLKKKGPVVPWVGANVFHPMSGKSYTWGEYSPYPEQVEIIDSPLHPQFMPNDGVNPWPDGIQLQLLRSDHHIWSVVSNSTTLRWSIRGESNDIIGSRPACGWAEYLKEREQ
jgi:hypothetical protein